MNSQNPASLVGEKLQGRKAAQYAIVLQDGLRVYFKNVFTGEIFSEDLEITVDDYCSWADGGLCIQDAMPQLDADDRELFLTGITDWSEAMEEVEMTDVEDDSWLTVGECMPEPDQRY